MTVWETVEHHRALMADKVVYPAIGEKMGKASGGVAWMYHVQFDAEVEKALNAPVTELGLWDLKESTDRTQFSESGKTVVPRIYEKLSSEVFEGGWGHVVESDRKFMICLGWYSVEVRVIIPAIRKLGLTIFTLYAALLRCIPRRSRAPRADHRTQRAV